MMLGIPTNPVIYPANLSVISADVVNHHCALAMIFVGAHSDMDNSSMLFIDLLLRSYYNAIFFAALAPGSRLRRLLL